MTRLRGFSSSSSSSLFFISNLAMASSAFFFASSRNVSMFKSFSPSSPSPPLPFVVVCIIEDVKNVSSRFKSSGFKPVASKPYAFKRSLSSLTVNFLRFSSCCPFVATTTVFFFVTFAAILSRRVMCVLYSLLGANVTVLWF